MSPEDFPLRVDVMPTARCNLEPPCPMCIGPDRSIPDGIDTEGWHRIIQFFADRGTESITFTGGEPLMREDIGLLMEFAKSCGMRVTLSTNALLLAEHIDEIAAYVDEVGIPIDGPTKEINSLLRIGDGQQLEAAITAVSLLRQANPDIEITIRTVMTTVNINSLPAIGQLLTELSGVDRWKIYHLLPAKGIIYTDSELNWDTLKTGPNEFDKVISDLKWKFPNLNIVAQTIAGQTKGYILVWPDGRVENLFRTDIGGFQDIPLKTLEANLSGLISRF